MSEEILEIARKAAAEDPKLRQDPPRERPPTTNVTDAEVEKAKGAPFQVKVVDCTQTTLIGTLIQ